MIYATCQTAAIDVRTRPTIASKNAELAFGRDSNVVEAISGIEMTEGLVRMSMGDEQEGA